MDSLQVTIKTNLLDRSWRKRRLILRRGRLISNIFGAKAHANVLKGTVLTDRKSNCIRIGLRTKYGSRQSIRLYVLGGGFCYSVISCRRYTAPALLASLKYAYSPCVLSSSLSSFFRFRFGHRFLPPSLPPLRPSSISPPGRAAKQPAGM